MAAPNIRRISTTNADAPEQLAGLRARLGAHGDLVSARNRELTQKVFGEALPPAKVVERVCNDVRSRGLAALLHYTEQFDKIQLGADTLRVKMSELNAAHAAADSAYLELVRRVRQNILSFQCGLLHRDAVLTAADYELRWRYRPMRRVGICIPGGAAAYPSTLLMTVCPAQAAGVKEMAVVIPPGPFGADNLDLLATCKELGVTEVYRVGGAQAVAALAYGVEGVPAVDMIVGPGNIFVTLAKKFVFGQVAIDMLAGPTELVVLADGSADPAHVAADLIAQAEHSPGASILISWQKPLFGAVLERLEQQLTGLPRGGLARDSLETFGAFIETKDAREGVAVANQIAPEHLHIATEQPQTLADLVQNAGAIFLGHHTPVALGDYVAGPSHVLPTGGTARFASGLCVNDFQRRSSTLAFTPEALNRVAGDVRTLAAKEGLIGHAASIDIRLAPNNHPPSTRNGQEKERAEKEAKLGV